jgi:hypothetical protein
MLYHLIVYAPLKDADRIRAAMAQSGAGRIGNYAGCSFSSHGTGRFTPNTQANPAIGTRGKPEEVEEERIEAVVQSKDLPRVLRAVKEAHPYEEPAIHVLPMLDYHTLL